MIATPRAVTEIRDNCEDLPAVPPRRQPQRDRFVSNLGDQQRSTACARTGNKTNHDRVGIRPDTLAVGRRDQDITRVRDNEDKNFIIPSPVHKYTTTNPSTLSPTYHLLYDLTSPTSPRTPLGATPTTIPTDAATKGSLPPSSPNSYPNSLHPHSAASNSGALQVNIGESNTPLWDRPAALVPGPGTNANNYSNKARQGISEPNETITAINSQDTVSSPTINGGVERPSTCHFVRTGEAENRGRAPGANNNGYIHNNNNSSGGHTNINTTTTIANTFGNTSQRSPASATTVAARSITLTDSYNVDVRPADAASISASFAPRSSNAFSSEHNVHKTRAGDAVGSPSVSYPVEFTAEDKFGRHNDRLKGTLNSNEDPRSICTSYTGGNESDSISNSRGIPVRDAISLWNNNTRRSDQNAGGIQNSNVSTAYKGNSKGFNLKDNFASSQQVQNCDSENLKRAVFKREGDGVRLFIVGNESLNDDSGIVCDTGHIQDTQASTAWPSHLSNSSAGVSIHSAASHSHRSADLKSKAKANAKGSNKGKLDILSKVTSKNNSNKKNTPKDSKPGVGRKPINRWDNIHVGTARTQTGVTNVAEHTGLTKETSSAQSGFSTSHDNRPSLNPDVPFHYAKGLEGGDKEKVNGNRAVIKGILVNKDNTGIANKSSGYGYNKVNSVQFVDDTFVVPDVCGSSSQTECIPTTSHGTRREVIDRSKYMIKPLQGQSNKDRLNRSYDSVLDSDSSHRLGNVKTSHVQSHHPRADQLRTLESSVSFDSRSYERHPSQSPRVEEDRCSQARFSTTSNTALYSSDHSRGSGQTHDLGGPYYSTQGSRNLDGQGQQELSSNRKQKEGGAAASRLGLAPPGGEISSGDYSHHNATDEQTLDVPASLDPHINPHLGYSTPGGPGPTTPSQSQRFDLHIRSEGPNPSVVSNDRGEIAGDETLRYRRNLREQCQKSQLWNLYGLDRENPWLKNRLKDDTSNVAITSSVLSQTGAVTWETKTDEKLQQKPPKITPRQKFEIRHNLVSEKVAANLRLRAQSEEVSGQAPSNSFHKESPRAKFERNRAAKTSAVTGNNSTTNTSIREKLNKSCDDIDTDGYRRPVADTYFSDQAHQLLSETSVSAPSLPPRKLSSTVSLESRGLQASAVSQSWDPNNSEDYVEGPNPISQSSWINKKFEPESNLGSRLERVQHIFKGSATANPRTHGQRNQVDSSSVRSVQWSEQAAREGESSREQFSSATPGINTLANIDTGLLHVSDGTGGGRCNNGPGDSSVPLSNTAGEEYNIHIGEDSRSADAGSKHHAGIHLENHKVSSKDHFLSYVSFDPGDNRGNNGACELESAEAQGLCFKPTSVPSESAGPQQGSAVKEMSPDSVSSSGYESENSSALRNNPGLNSTGNLANQSLVQQLRLRFGHSDYKGANRSETQTGTEQGNVNISRQKLSLPLHQNTLHPSQGENTESDCRLSSHPEFPKAGLEGITENLHQRRSDKTVQQISSPRQVSCDVHSPGDGFNKSKHEKRLYKVSRSMHGIIHDLSPEGCGRPNCKRAAKRKSSKHPRGSPSKGEDSHRRNSSSSENTGCEYCSRNDTCLSEDVLVSHSESAQIFYSRDAVTSDNINSSEATSRTFQEEKAVMLASKGLRIYESGEEYIAMKSPVKSPLHKSLSAPQFLWEGATYLIVPTVVESFTSTTTCSNAMVNNNNNNGDNNNNSHADLMMHRSISDSGAPVRHGSTSREDGEVFVENDNQTDEGSNAYLAMSSGERKLSSSQRAMSVDVLCAEGVSSTPHWNNERTTRPRKSSKQGKDEKHGGRGYVEWKTCSGWVGKTDMRKADGRNSRGYVEWDTIWTAAAPWHGDPKDDEHVYDVIAEDSSSHSGEDNIPGPGTEAKTVTPVTLDTPPALPERTYINRLKNNNVNSNCSPSSPRHSCSSHSPHHHHQHHHHHHGNNGSCKKHHHHHHRNHHQHHKHHDGQSSSSTSSTTTTTPTSSRSSAPSSHQSKHAITTTANAQLVVDGSQNYAEVHKLKGYKFTNLMTVSDSPVPHQPDKAAIYSENYWHLAPVTSQDRAMTWQSGDVLDYIDGLHDSMSPKRRENIYILLNNKKTRAKFSESLEIESRLMSKGLITGSSGSPKETSQMDVAESQAPPAIKSGIIRKGATAPVSSTYV